ncbi:MAG: protein-methionine-sulfoxide reductase catalytic subunit MsrP [Alphaproteobacteria bacterium]|nr:protein-methionine-sulfoxide reductase catalytic subunit MsrP [Alphaproteobacteria bacterium]
MLIKCPRGWELPESMATPETAYFNRRTLMKGLAAGSILAATGFPSGHVLAAKASDPPADDPSAKLYPFKKNEKYTIDRALTDPEVNATYNNFYEFGSHKEIWKDAQKLPIRPWMVTIDGLVENKIEISVDDLMAKMQLEERLYRHRCVEAWAMTIPWSGFPLKVLVEFAKPLSAAKYLVMETFTNAKVASGQKQFWYPWPYVDGLTIEEATNELAFIATGAYGKPMAKQHGSPLRLAVPWKYGFKHVKSIVRFSFADKQPKTFWQTVQASEYGFWANVNPEVAHPRWSQKTERLLGSGVRVPTLLYNGYAEAVAALYLGKEKEPLFR